MTLDRADGKEIIRASKQFSNDAWFDKLGIDKAIAKALKNGYNRKFYCLN